MSILLLEQLKNAKIMLNKNVVCDGVFLESGTVLIIDHVIPYIYAYDANLYGTREDTPRLFIVEPSDFEIIEY